MPAAKRVRWAQLRVGVMAVVAMIILGVLIWLLTSQKPFWESYSKLYTYMRDTTALSKGAPVRLNGILIGSVKSIDLSRSSDPNRTVRIEMNVESGRLKDIPADSIAGLSAENVLGTKFINIDRGRSSQSVRPDAEIRSEPSEEIEDLVRKGFDLFDSAQAMLNRADRIISEVESGQGSIGKFIVDPEFYDRTVATVAELQKVSSALSSGQGTMGKLLYDPTLYDKARSSIDRLDSMMADLQNGQGTAGKLLKDPAAYDELRASLAQAHHLLDDLNAGQGTAGKLLTDDTAYKQMQGVLGKLDTAIGKINSGEGTLGQLVVNPQLYNSLNALSVESRSLVKDIRANPKKFLRIKLGLF